MSDQVSSGKATDEWDNNKLLQVYLFAAMRGIFLVYAELSSLVRKHIAGMLSNRDIPWSVVLSTSALAEGVNMSSLDYVLITVLWGRPASCSYRSRKRNRNWGEWTGKTLAVSYCAPVPRYTTARMPPPRSR
jgi:hypothetical protein